MIKKIFLGCFLCLLFFACSKKIYFGKNYENWESKALPDSTEKVYTMYLIGDVGDPYNKESNLDLLSSMLNKDSLSSVVFLGDNVYIKGMPPEGATGRATAEKIIDRQLEVVKDYTGAVFFIPGNHDWDYMGREGWERINAQEAYLESKLNRGNNFLPDDGCPGPIRVSVNDEVVLIILDTQWWLHKYKKPYGRSSNCSAINETDMLVQLRDIVEKNRGRHIVIAAHHPLFTNGNHGGHFNILDHLFPLRLIDHRWYMYFPLPGIGSIYPLYRKFGGTEQDLSNYKYQQLKKEIMKIVEDNDEVIYVAGHEHALQYFKVGEFHEIVSGSGCRINPVRGGGDAAFIYKNYGFARLTFYTNGQAWTEFIVPDDKYPNGRVAFRYPLYKKMEIYPESYCTLSRLDYSDSSITVAASDQYDISKFKRKIFGEHYRKAWTTPIQVPLLDLATEEGGIIPYALGGGKQSLSLKLRNPDEYEFVARKIDKDPQLGFIPKELTNTAAGTLIQDQISAQHPYGAVTVPPFTKALGILHTEPKITYIPKDSCLGPYIKTFSDQMVIFEEDPDESHAEAANLGYSKNIVGTDKLWSKLEENNDNTVDYYAFARARLLDMWLGDWDRHESQYRWAELDKKGKGDLYTPVPEDRDQVYFKFDGIMPFFASRKWAFRPLQHFDYKIEDVIGMNYSARPLDGRLLAQLSKEEWIAIADSMTKILSDSLIEYAIRRMPKPVFEIDGEEIIKKLKSRRAQLPEVAEKYYKVLSKYVDVYGSDKAELFVVNRIANDKTELTVYKKNKQGELKKTLFKRTFNDADSKEIRLYGLAGDDHFIIEGEDKNKLLVRIIGGDGFDTLTQKTPELKNFNLTEVYDIDTGIFINDKNNLVLHLSKDPDINLPDEDKFFYRYAGPSFEFKYNQGDGLFIGLGAVVRNYRFRANPYGERHRILGSFATAAPSFRFKYTGDYRKLIGSTDFSLLLDSYLPYFAMNYFGYGNDSPEPVNDISYYRVRMKYLIINPSIIKRFANYLETGFGPKLEYYELVNRENSFVNDFVKAGNPDYFKNQFYLGLKAYFKLGGRDNEHNPKRGLILTGEANVNQGLNQSKSFYSQLKTEFKFYMTPNLSRQLTFAGRIGAAANNGDFTFYQANTLDGLTNLRGFYKTRFVGDQVFYQNLEARYSIFELKSKILSGNMGATAFIDNGKVWPDSGGYHTGYGGGLWFNMSQRLVLASYLGFSNEGKRFLLNLGFFY